MLRGYKVVKTKNSFYLIASDEQLQLLEHHFKEHHTSHFQHVLNTLLF